MTKLKIGKYCLIPCTKSAGITAGFSLSIFYDGEIKVTKWKDPKAEFTIVNNDFINPPKLSADLK